MSAQAIVGRYVVYCWTKPVQVVVQFDQSRQIYRHLLCPVNERSIPIEANAYCEDGMVYMLTATGVHRYIWRTQRHG